MFLYMFSDLLLFSIDFLGFDDGLSQIVEFIAVLLKTRSEATGKELATSGAIRRVLDLFFE